MHINQKTEIKPTAVSPAEAPALTEDEKIDLAANSILNRFRAAFEELAK